VKGGVADKGRCRKGVLNTEILKGKKRALSAGGGAGVKNMGRGG